MQTADGGQVCEDHSTNKLYQLIFIYYLSLLILQHVVQVIVLPLPIIVSPEVSDFVPYQTANQNTYILESSCIYLTALHLTFPACTLHMSHLLC